MILLHWKKIMKIKITYESSSVHKYRHILQIFHYLLLIFSWGLDNIPTACPTSISSSWEQCLLTAVSCISKYLISNIISSLWYTMIRKYNLIYQSIIKFKQEDMEPSLDKVSYIWNLHLYFYSLILVMDITNSVNALRNWYYTKLALNKFERKYKEKLYEENFSRIFYMSRN